MKKLIILSMMTLLWQGILAQDKVWSLEDCIGHAIENNIIIKQQELQTKYQENILKQSKLSLLPSVNGTATQNFSFGRALDETTYQFTENENVTSNSFYGGANVTLFNGLQNLNRIKKSRFDLAASQLDLQIVKDETALSVALAYLQILLNRELVTATSNQLETTREQIEKTRKLVEAGSLPKGNLLEIEAQAAREELQLIDMQNQLAISYLTLAQLLELDSSEGFEILVPEISIGQQAGINGTVTDIYNIAESTRPEIKSSQVKLEGAETDLAIAKGGRSPRLTLATTFSTGYSDIRQKLLGPDPVTGFPLYTSDYPFIDQLNDNINYGIGFTLSIPVFNGWQVNTNISNSKISIENFRYTLENSKKQLYKTIQQAYADAEGAMKSYIASVKAVESMEESFRYMEQRFNVDLVTPVEYNASKTQLLNAQSDLAQAKYQYIFKTKVLDFYKGIPLSLDQ